jgi:rhodanese-related sulfurtransferase
MSTVLGFAFTAFAGRGLFAPVKAASTNTPTQSSSTFVTYEEAVEYFASGKALFVDARHEYDFKLGHIKGAVNLPLSEFDQRTEQLTTLAKDALLITYCDGEECNSSVDLATKLYAAGFTNVKIFFGGWTQWTAHHQKTEPALSGPGEGSPQ